jgi:hypothetical protein
MTGRVCKSLDFSFQTSWVTLPVALCGGRPAARLPAVQFVGPRNSECERSPESLLAGERPGRGWITVPFGAQKSLQIACTKFGEMADLTDCFSL